MTSEDRPQLATRRKAMEAMIREAAETYSIAVNPAALASLAARAAHELSLDAKGYPVDANGKFRPMVKWLTETQKDAPYFFLNGPAPAESLFEKTVEMNGFGKNLEHIAAGKTGVHQDQARTDRRPVISPNEMGRRLADVAAGKVRVAADLGPD
jgi:hypothetical protein